MNLLMTSYVLDIFFRNCIIVLIAAKITPDMLTKMTRSKFLNLPTL